MAVIYLGARRDKTLVVKRTIATELNIPPHCLSKILQQFTQHCIVRSQKGKSGGFALDRSPEDISLYNIIHILDGNAFPDQCVLGFAGCDDDDPCPLHEQWSQVKTEIVQIFKEHTVQDISAEVGPKLDSIRSTIHNLRAADQAAGNSP